MVKVVFPSGKTTFIIAAIQLPNAINLTKLIRYF